MFAPQFLLTDPLKQHPHLNFFYSLILTNLLTGGSNGSSYITISSSSSSISSSSSMSTSSFQFSNAEHKTFLPSSNFIWYWLYLIVLSFPSTCPSDLCLYMKSVPMIFSYSSQVPMGRPHLYSQGQNVHLMKGLHRAFAIFILKTHMKSMQSSNLSHFMWKRFPRRNTFAVRTLFCYFTHEVFCH